METVVQFSVVGQFISTLFSSRTQAHILHLQTNSFAVHKALQKYYEGIVDLTDSLVEGYQGKYGIVTGYSNVDLLESKECADVIKYFMALSIFIDRTRVQMPQDSYIQNIIDEIINLINSTLYKLKSLK